MGKYIRKCKAVGDVAVMDVSPVGVRTRARTLALAAAAGTGKRIVSASGELRTVRMQEDSENSDDRITADRCSSNGSSELVKEWLRSADSEVEFECRCNPDEIQFEIEFRLLVFSVSSSLIGLFFLYIFLTFCCLLFSQALEIARDFHFTDRWLLRLRYILLLFSSFFPPFILLRN